MTILRGLQVVEIPHLGAAAWTGKQLADWGASVVLLEPATGTPLREEPPYYVEDRERRSASWAWLSRGKTSVRAGQGTSVSSDSALRFCEAADLVVLEAGMAEPVLGRKPEELREHFSGKTTFVLISPFSSDGPYASYNATDLGINAMGGWMGMLGHPVREPLRPGAEMSARVAGLFALVAALAALRYKNQGGEVQTIDVSAQATAASVIVGMYLANSFYGIEDGRRGNVFPMGPIHCADGFIGLTPLTVDHWERLCHLLEIEDVLNEPHGREYRKLGPMIYERVKPWFEARTRAEILELEQAWRLPAAPVETVADRLVCPQLNARKFFVEADVGGVTVKTPRVPFRIEGAQPVERSHPTVAEVLPKRSGAAVQSRSHRDTGLPYSEIRVLDLTHFWSGPFATMLLGALGADVIKIEAPRRPDSYRYLFAQQTADRWIEGGPFWNDTNNNKRGLTLDLTTPAGKEIFERLVPLADVVVSNFSNRVMPNLGLTNERLLSLNSRLLTVTLPGYGPGGPWEDYVGFGDAFEYVGAIASMTGYQDGVPTYPRSCDPIVGLHVVTAIDLALTQREITGKGMEVEVPQCECLDSLFAPEQIAVQLGAPVPERRGNKHDWMAPNDAYQCAGDDEWITIAIASNEEFASLARVLGTPELAGDARFSTVAARKTNEGELDAVIGGLVRERDVRELEKRLQAAGVKGCRVSKPFHLTQDEGLQHIDFFQYQTREVTGTHPYKKWPFLFSSLDASHKQPPPLLGQHTAEVLTELLGFSEEDLRRLREQQVIGEATEISMGQQ